MTVSRVVSLLPAATEIVHALGAGELLVGRSHECDWPPEVARLPVVSRPTLDLDGLDQSEIDAAVAGRLREGGTLYAVDERLLRELAPDVVLTQDLCQVCAPSGNELTRAIAELPRKPELVWLTPHTIEEVHRDVLAVGAATGRDPAAAELVRESRSRLERVAAAARKLEPRRVVFLEWVEPYFSAGHWVPEMIALAGGHDPLASRGGDSRRIEWDQVMAARPEVVIVSPCGYGLERAAELARGLPEVGGAEVYAVDANAYFARPGPRLAEGVELLASVLHPAEFGSPPPDRAVRVA